MDQVVASELAMAKPTPIVRDADALLRRGIEALERERHEEAVVLLRQAVEPGGAIRRRPSGAGYRADAHDADA